MFGNMIIQRFDKSCRLVENKKHKIDFISSTSTKKINTKSSCLIFDKCTFDSKPHQN